MPAKGSQHLMVNSELNLNTEIAIDTETTGLWYYLDDRPYMISMCDEEYNSWCVWWYVNPYTREPMIDYDSKEYWYVKEICENEDIVKDFFHARFDRGMLRSIGINVRGKVHDSGFMARINHTDMPSYGLKRLCKVLLGMEPDDEERLKAGLNQLKRRLRQRKWDWNLAEDIEADMWLVQYAKALANPGEEAEFEALEVLTEDYCRKDTLRTIFLRHYFKPIFDENPNLYTTYERERALYPVMLKVEDRGISIDPDQVKKDLDHCTVEANKALLAMQKMTGNPDFNPGSPKQVAEFMYGEDKLGLEPVSWSETGSPRTDHATIFNNYRDEPFCQMLLEYRMYSKGIATFFEKYNEVMRPDPLVEGGFVLHPGFNQLVTRTARFSCSHPNLQQVSNPESSIKGSGVIQAKAPFGPRPGYSWYLLDYSGQELRIFAGLAQVESMLEAIYAGRDLNNENANKVWGGRDNPAAIRAAKIALQLGSVENRTAELDSAWNRIGWNEDMAKKFAYSSEADEAAMRWLEEFDWKTANAEKSLGRSGLRSRCKICTFAKLYGGGWKAIKNLIMDTESRCREFMHDLERAFPEIDEYGRHLIKEVKKTGYIINPYGRRINVDLQFAYKAINYSVQSTAADMMKLSMIRVNEYLERTGLDAHIVLTIHDELIVEVRNDHTYHWLIQGVKNVMEDHESVVGVPMQVSINRVDHRWFQEEKYECPLPLAA